MAISIAILLTISMGTSMILIPKASAHSPPWTEQSYAYVVGSPNPVGVGQVLQIYMWIDTPLGAVAGNDVRRANYMLTITAPDGTVTKQTWATVSDPTGIQSISILPMKPETTHSHLAILGKLTFGTPQILRTFQQLLLDFYHHTTFIMAIFTRRQRTNTI